MGRLQDAAKGGHGRGYSNFVARRSSGQPPRRPGKGDYCVVFNIGVPFWKRCFFLEKRRVFCFIVLWRCVWLARLFDIWSGTACLRVVSVYCRRVCSSQVQPLFAVGVGSVVFALSSCPTPLPLSPAKSGFCGIALHWICGFSSRNASLIYLHTTAWCILRHVTDEKGVFSPPLPPDRGLVVAV